MNFHFTYDRAQELVGSGCGVAAVTVVAALTLVAPDTPRKFRPFRTNNQFPRLHLSYDNNRNLTLTTTLDLSNVLCVNNDNVKMFS